MLVAKLAAIGLFGLTCLVNVVAQTSAIGTQSQSSAVIRDDVKLQLVFYGYPKIGVPQSGAAEITERGFSNMRDISFTRIGGELSPNGRLIAYDSCSSTKRGIYIAEPDGSKAQMVTPLTGSPCVDGVRWSPDGAKVSYTGPPDWSLRILDIATKEQKLIPNTSGADWHWWAPAGDEIVYGQKPIRSIGRLLYITDLSGNSRQLTFAQDFVPCDLYTERNLIDTWAPAWSPKGDAIAFTQCGALFIISPSGKDLRQLTRPRTGTPEALPLTEAYSPRWSPDGRWIIFTGEIPCRISEGPPLKRISPDNNSVVDIGRLPYCGGPFSIAPLRK